MFGVVLELVHDSGNPFYICICGYAFHIGQKNVGCWFPIRARDPFIYADA